MKWKHNLKHEICLHVKNEQDLLQIVAFCQILYSSYCASVQLYIEDFEYMKFMY